MDKILKQYSKADIMRICEVSKGTTYNWENKNNMPMWAIERLGYKIVPNLPDNKQSTDEVKE